LIRGDASSTSPIFLNFIISISINKIVCYLSFLFGKSSFSK